MTSCPRTPGVLQGAPHAPAQDRPAHRLTWTGAVTTTYAPTKSLHDVVPQVRGQFEALIAHATELGLKPVIRSAGRTCEEQAEQVKFGYSHADLCRSMHVLGHAVDLDLTPNTCENHTKLGAWWEGRGGVWGGRWKQFGACGDMGHYHFGFGGAGAVPTSVCPASVSLEECQKLREAYLDKAYAAGPGVSSKSGLWAGLAIAAAGAAFVWAALSVKPGRLAAAVRSNPHPQLSPGQLWRLRLERAPVVETHGYMERMRETTKTLVVVSVQGGCAHLKDTKGTLRYAGTTTKFPRHYELCGERLSSSQKPPLRYYVLGMEQVGEARENPRFKYDAWEAVVYLPGGHRETWGPATFAAASEVAARFRFQTRDRCPPHGCDTSVQRVAGKPKYELVNGELRKIARRAA